MWESKQGSIAGNHLDYLRRQGKYNRKTFNAMTKITVFKEGLITYKCCFVIWKKN